MGVSLNRSNFHLVHIVLITLGIVCLLGIIIVLSPLLPPGVDWHDAFRPAALSLLSGESPFRIDLYYAPPWSLLPLIPLALLPEQIGRGLLMVLGFLAYLYAGYRLGAKPPALFAFLLSPMVLHNLLNSNIDWMPLLGFTLPPQIGLFFVLTKPQVGIGVALFWLIEAWRTGGFRKIITIAWPFTMITVITFVLFGFWPLRFINALQRADQFNSSLWPLTLPIGFTLLVSAIRKRDIRYSMPAGPCLSPYALFHSWIAALAPILSMNVETIVAVIGLWIMVIIRAVMGGL